MARYMAPLIGVYTGTNSPGSITAQVEQLHFGMNLMLRQQILVGKLLIIVICRLTCYQMMLFWEMYRDPAKCGTLITGFLIAVDPLPLY